MIQAWLAVAFLALAMGVGAEDQAGFAPASDAGPEAAIARAPDARPSDADLSPGTGGQEAIAQALALASSGQAAEARQLLAAVAASEDPQLAALARYNLGCLVAGQARELFGTTPEQLPAAQRQQGLALLAEACEHYRQCLRHDPQHGDARHNLELIRLWIGAHRQLWHTEAGTRLAAAPKPSWAPGSKPAPKPAGSPAAKSPGKPEAKELPSGTSAQAKQAPAPKPQPPEASSATAAPADPVRQYAEDLMAKVRQRIGQRRQQEQSRLLPRWSHSEEKDW